jgi:FKBP-type peptidyl-prolyl cis-trans isomerase SlyD
MEITENSVVSFNYTLRNADGEVLDSSEGQDPLTYLHGNDQIVPGLEIAMIGRKVGDGFSVTVSPEEGYGVQQDALIQTVPRSAFDGIDAIEAGMTFQADGPQGPMVVRVVSVDDESVTVDGNHDLAGATLNFTIEITEIRAASEQELEHGHVHSNGDDH